MGFFDAVLRCFARYAQFSGRASRAEYWWFIVFLCGAHVGLSIFSGRALYALMAGEEGSGWIWLWPLFSLATLVPLLSVTVRRLHDLGLSGFWLLFTLIPVSWIGFAIAFAFPGDPAPNRYGGNPVIDADAARDPRALPQTPDAPDARYDQSPLPRVPRQ